MTCEHCRSAVIEEVGGVDGVDAVEVDLDSGRLDVRGGAVSDDQVAAAVAEAGYEVCDRFERATPRRVERGGGRRSHR